MQTYIVCSYVGNFQKIKMATKIFLKHKWSIIDSIRMISPKDDTWKTLPQSPDSLSNYVIY